MEKIFLEKPDWKKKEKHHQTGKTKDSSLVSVYLLITKVSIDGPTIPKTKAVVGCLESRSPQAVTKNKDQKKIVNL